MVEGSFLIFEAKSLALFFFWSVDSGPFLVGIGNAKRGAGGDFRRGVNDAGVVVVGFEFEGGELPFEIRFAGFLVDEENLGFAGWEEDFALFVGGEGEGLQVSDREIDRLSIPKIANDKSCLAGAA